MSSLQENLLNSFEILAKGYMQQAPGTVVIEGVIHQIVNAGTGQYIVSYLDNLLDVYANNANVQFNIGDKVYVLVPNGDFSKQKIIISMSTPSTMIYDSSEMDKYMEVSDNLFNNIEQIELSTYKTENIQIGNYWYGNFSNLFPKYLKNYSTFLFSVDIRTEIKTEQQINGNYGIKLQLPFYFYNSNKEKIETWKTYTLDVNNISGNPYRLTEWTKQNIFIQLSSEEKYDNNREPQLNIFVKDFAQDAAAAHIKDIKIKNIGFYAYDILSEEQQQGYYLHLKASEGNYFFLGEDTESKTLTPTLKANGRNVKLTTSHTSIEDTYQCYWFIEDASIKEDSELYTNFGGVGWKCLNDKTNVVANEDGTTSFDFVTNKYEYQVYAKDVLTSARYKCIIVVVKNINNEKTYTTTVSSILKLENLKASIDMSVESITGSNSYIKNIGEVGLSCTLVDENRDFFNNYNDYSITYEWNRYDKNNKYLDNDFYTVKVNSNKQNDNEHIIYQQISLKTSLIEDINIFTCSAYINYVDGYGLFKKQLLGTESILINTNGTSSYNLSIQNGDVLYKYDTDGDSPLSEKYDGPLDTKVTMIKPLSYTIYKADGTEFTDSEYAYCKTTWLIPKNSLITAVGGLQEYDSDYYQYSGTGRFGFNYTLASKYNFKKDNNVIRLKINYGDIELYADAALKILKEGENGTNNSNYSIIITHNDASYGESKNGVNQKLQAIYCLDKKKWYYHNLENNILEEFAPTTIASQKLGLKLYDSGEEIQIDESKVNIEWTLFDVEVTNPCMGFTYGGSFNEEQHGGKECWIGPKVNDFQWNDGDVFVNIIQAKVVILNETELYAYYPIEIIKVDKEEYIKKVDINGNTIYTIPTCIGGYSSVLYSSDGTNPQYNSSEPFTCVDSVFSDIDYKDHYQYKWSSSSNLTPQNLVSQNLEKNQINFRPIAKYDSSISKNYISAVLTLSNQTGQNIETEIQNQKNIYEDNQNKKDNIETEKQQISNFLIEVYKIKSKNNYNLDNLLELSKSYLQVKAKVLNSLKELEKRYNEFLAYYNSLNMSSTLLDAYIEYKDDINDIRTQTRKDENIDNIEIEKINLTKNEVIQEVKNFVESQPSASKFLLGSRVTTFNTEKIDVEPLNYTSVGSILYSFITSYNEQFNIFKKDYDNYILEDKSHFDLIKILYLEDITNNNNLINLSILKNQLSALGQKFTVDSDECAVTYSDVLNNIINEAFKLISYYGNDLGELSEAAINNFNEREKQYEENMTAAEKEYNRLIIYLNDNAEILTYIRPIVMTYNRYSLSAISGWDGNRLYTGSGNTGDYLYTPQVGAGKKNDDGSFTGIVIGHKKESDKSKIGLFGFNTGIESIFLNAEDGSATFGVSGEGQIQMNPGGTSTIAGWQINNSSLSKKIGSNSVSLYSSNSITEDGHAVALKATDGTNKAIITYDGWFKSNYGEIGGWTIGASSLTGGDLTLNKNGSIYSKEHNSFGSDKNGFYLSASGLSIGSKFSVSNTGILTTKELLASGGEIGGWFIESSQLKSRQSAYGQIIINAGGSIKHLNSDGSEGNWSISRDGTAIFKGKNSSFGGVSINSYGQTGGSFVSGFGVSGTAKDNFNDLVANKVTANYVSARAIEAGFIKADTIAATYATINTLNAVDAKFNNLNADNITSGTLSADRIDVNSLSIGASKITGTTHATTATGGTVVRIRCMAYLPGTSGWQEQEFSVYSPTYMKKLYVLKMENA